MMLDQESETGPEAAELAAVTTSPAPQKVPPQRSKRKKRQSYKKEDVLLRFHSCGRCSLFLAGYRLQHEAEFEQAIGEVEADWLPLPWTPDMRELVNKSYGSRTDIEVYYLEGTCPECRRPFAYAEPHPDQSAWFVVKL